MPQSAQSQSLRFSLPKRNIQRYKGDRFHPKHSLRRLHSFSFLAVVIGETIQRHHAIFHRDTDVCNLYTVFMFEMCVP